MTDEQRELMRQASERLLKMEQEGRRIDPESLAWARWNVAHIKPLARPLTDGFTHVLTES